MNDCAKYKIVDRSLYITDNVSDDIEIKKTEHGFGLFANKKIVKGKAFISERFFIFDEHSIDRISLITNKGEYELDKYVHGGFNYTETEKLWIGTYTSFFNHSCNPNVTFETLNEYFDTNFVAIKEINEGEELTMNYNSFYYDMKIPIKCCKCGSFNCQVEIKGYKYLDDSSRTKIHEILTKVDIEDLALAVELDKNK